jgi:hypothetical protein
MAIFGFALGALLVVCGLGSLAVALNLVPTDMGMLYAVSGVILLGCGSIVLAIAALTARVGRLSPRPALRPQLRPAPLFEAEEAAPDAPPPDMASFDEAQAEAQEDAQQPRIVGRYSSSSGRYLVFSDGAVEAETAEGAFRFDSLNDFKAYVASRAG